MKRKLRFNQKSAFLLAAVIAVLLTGCGKQESTKKEINIDDIVIGGTETSGGTVSGDSSGGNGSVNSSGSNSSGSSKGSTAGTLQASDEAEEATAFAYDGETVYPASSYVLFMQDPFSEIQTAYDLNYNEVTTADVMLSDGTISTGSQYISTNADEEFKWMYVLNHLSEEAGLKSEDSSYYAQAVYYAGQTYKDNPDYYKYFNIDMAQLLEFYLYQYKANDLFYKMYGTGGEKAIPEEELCALMDDGAYRFSYILLPYYDTATSEQLSTEEITKRKEMIADYASRAEAGEVFADLVYESYQYLEPSTEKNADPAYYENYIAKDNSSFLTGIMTALADMKDGEIRVISGDTYSSVVKKLAVNEKTGTDSWTNTAMQLAYASEYGSEFDTWLIGKYTATEVKYNEAVRKLLTPEYYADMLDSFYKKS